MICMGWPESCFNKFKYVRQHDCAVKYFRRLIMKVTRLITLFLLATLAQGASATTIWLKDRNGQVCKNTASANAGGVIGLGSVDRNGVITMTIDNPDTGTETRSPSTGDCANLPRTPAGNPSVFNGNVTPSIVPIHMLKPGTKGALECLDQGSNFAGVNGSVVSGPQTISFGFGYTDGCTGGNALPTFSRPADCCVQCQPPWSLPSPGWRGEFDHDSSITDRVLSSLDCSWLDATWAFAHALLSNQVI
jgi:hypothetical protein